MFQAREASSGEECLALAESALFDEPGSFSCTMMNNGESNGKANGK